MIFVAFRHGLRSSELVALRWDQIDFDHAILHVRRTKEGTPATHPRGRTTGPAPTAAGAGSQVAIRVHQRRARRSRRRALLAWSSALVTRPSSAFRLILTCCATPVALRSPTRATIRGRCRLTSATAIFSTRCDTPSCRRAGSRTFGDDRIRLAGRQETADANRDAAAARD